MKQSRLEKWMNTLKGKLFWAFIGYGLPILSVFVGDNKTPQIIIWVSLTLWIAFGIWVYEPYKKYKKEEKPL